MDDRLKEIFSFANICAFEVVSQAWEDFPGSDPYSTRKRNNSCADAVKLLWLMAEYKKE